MVTLKTVAVEAGVAPSTVSRVLSGDETCYISEEKKNRIFEVSKRLNYSPNFSARNLATGKTFNIAYVLCLFSHLEHLEEQRSPFYRMIDRIHEGLKEHGYILSVITVSYNDLAELKSICASTRLYDGLIFARGVISREGARIVKNSAVPAVVIDDSRPWLAGISGVLTDKQKAVTEIIAHLKEMGHEKIASCGFGEHLEFYREAMKKNGLGYCDSLNFRLRVEDDHQLMLESYVCAEKILRGLDGMSAVFCTNDYAALGLCRRFSEAGIQVGKDVSVAGFDNIEELSKRDEADRFLTTVEKPYEEMGQNAVEILLQSIASGGEEVVKKESPCRIIFRKSTGRRIFNAG